MTKSITSSLSGNKEFETNLDKEEQVRRKIPLNLWETESGLELWFALPQETGKKMELSVIDRALSLSLKEGSIHYHRTVKLSSKVDIDQLSAAEAGGILKVIAPWKEVHARRVEIHT